MWIVGLAMLWTASLTWAQYRNTQPMGEPSDYLHSQSTLGLRSLRGLIDPSRMHMSQSFSVGYMSSGGRGGTEAMYMNQIDYDISRKVFLTTHLGYRFQPSRPAAWNPGLSNGDFVGGADLNWRPTENTNFRFSVYRNYYPDYYYDGFGWGSHHYRSNFDRP
jgi:hypothetical protein